MALAYNDFGTTSEVSVEKPKFSQPIVGQAINYIIQQRYRQLGTYTPPALNTVHPDFAGFFFVGDGDQQPLGGGVQEWIRRWAAVPATHDEPQSYPMTLIGLFATGGPVTFTTGRLQRTQVVTSRVQHDYFLTGAGATYATANDVPRINGMKFLLQISNSSQVGSIYYPTDILATNTIPTVSYYQAMMRLALKKSWTGSVVSQTILDADGSVRMSDSPNPLGSQFAAEDSRIDRWEGNIFVRTTRYVLAI